MAEQFGLEPYSDRIIVKQIEIEQKTAGGIILATPEPLQEQYFGVAVAVGEGKRLENGEPLAMKTKVGDTISFNPRIGVPLKYEGQDYLLIRESEIYYKIKN